MCRIHLLPTTNDKLMSLFPLWYIYKIGSKYVSRFFFSLSLFSISYMCTGVRARSFSFLLIVRTITTKVNAYSFASNIQLYVRKNIRKNALHDASFQFPLLVTNASFFFNDESIQQKKITDVMNGEVSFCVRSIRNYLVRLWHQETIGHSQMSIIFPFVPIYIE